MKNKESSQKRIYTQYKRVRLDHIEPDKNQPRKEIIDETLRELGASFGGNDPLQAILVRPNPEKPRRYTIVIGERRWRAARLIGLQSLMVGIRKNDPEDPYITALKENLQREDLNPLDASIALNYLHDERHMSWIRISATIKKSLAWIQVRAPLAKQLTTVQRLVRVGDLSLKGAKNLSVMHKRHGVRPQTIIQLAQKEARGETSIAVDSYLRDSSRKEALINAHMPRKPAELLQRLLRVRGSARSTIIALRAFSEQPAMKQKSALDTLTSDAKQLLHRDFKALAKAIRQFIRSMEKYSMRDDTVAKKK